MSLQHATEIVNTVRLEESVVANELENLYSACLLVAGEKNQKEVILSIKEKCPKASIYKAVEGGCKGNHVELVKWISRHYSLERVAFTRALCTYPHLDILKDCTTPELIQKVYNVGFKAINLAACEYLLQSLGKDRKLVEGLFEVAINTGECDCIEYLMQSCDISGSHKKNLIFQAVVKRSLRMFQIGIENSSIKADMYLVIKILLGKCMDIFSYVHQNVENAYEGGKAEFLSNMREIICTVIETDFAYTFIKYVFENKLVTQFGPKEIHRCMISQSSKKFEILDYMCARMEGGLLEDDCFAEFLNSHTLEELRDAYSFTNLRNYLETQNNTMLKPSLELFYQYRKEVTEELLTCLYAIPKDVIACCLVPYL